MLFIDARHIFRQVDRAHRKFSPKQVEYLANIVRLYRGEQPEFMAGEDEELPGEDPDLKATFPKLKYADVAGLCKVATLDEIEAQGWEPTELGSCSQIVPGYAFKSKDWQESGVPVVKIKNITENNCVDIESADCVSESLISDKMYKFMLKTGDLLIAMTGATAGKACVLRMRVPSALNQRVAKICPNDGFRSLLWCFIIGNRKLFFNLADGAAQPNMSGRQIESVPLLVPSGHILSLFESSVCDIAKLVDSLYFKNRNLRTTRDLRLPKLISGLLDVEDLDIDTGLTAEEKEEATA